MFFNEKHFYLYKCPLHDYHSNCTFDACQSLLKNMCMLVISDSCDDLGFVSFPDTAWP